MKNRLLARVGVALIVAEALLVIFSWLLSAMRLPGVRSLLSSEGIRWFFGTFIQMVASPMLVWLLLILVAYGTVLKSGVTLFSSTHPSLSGDAAKTSTRLSYRDRIAFRVALAFILIYIIIITLLVTMPHGILLSVTGSLFPSAFSRALVPIITFGMSLFSIVFGLMSGRFVNLTHILEALSYGISKGAPLFILYILFIQLVFSLSFVFN